MPCMLRLALTVADYTRTFPCTVLLLIYHYVLLVFCSEVRITAMYKLIGILCDYECSVHVMLRLV
jgi:hypothetical protein